MADDFLGLPGWLWGALVLVIAVAVIVVRGASSRAGHRREQERLAQTADAHHESAQTRHEGGA